MEKRIAAILVTLCLLGVPLFADEIILNNGDQVSGNVVELGATALRIVTESGEILIPRDKVASAFLGSANYSTSSREVNTLENCSENYTSAHGMEAAGDEIPEE